MDGVVSFHIGHQEIFTVLLQRLYFKPEGETEEIIQMKVNAGSGSSAIHKSEHFQHASGRVSMDFVNERSGTGWKEIFKLRSA